MTAVEARILTENSVLARQGKRKLAEAYQQAAADFRCWDPDAQCKVRSVLEAELDAALDQIRFRASNGEDKYTFVTSRSITACGAMVMYRINEALTARGFTCGEISYRTEPFEEYSMRVSWALEPVA